MRKTTSEIMHNLKGRSIKFLDLTRKSSEKKLLLAAFERVLSSGVFILGQEVEKFEKNFAKYLGLKYCIGVANGLEALQIALMALDIKAADEVITTPISAVATTLAIMAVGAKPVFVDTLENGLINPDLIPQVITKRTKAILPVHLYGNPVQLDKIQKICKKYKLGLIEDAAQAHGSKFKNKSLGAFGSLGCFSFYPTKNLASLGDGGAIVTNNVSLAKICFEIRDYGQTDKYVHSRFGLNSRLDELQAAFLNVHLQQLDKDNHKRRQLAQRYIENLATIKKVEIVKETINSEGNFHLFVIKTKKRNQLKEYLKKLGIQTLIHYSKIIPEQPFLKKEYGYLSLPVARTFVKTCLSLPMYPRMNLQDVDFFCSKIKQFPFV